MKRQKLLLTVILAGLMVSAGGCGSAGGNSEAASQEEAATAAPVTQEVSQEETEAPAETEAPEETTTTETTTEEPEETAPQATTNTTYDVGDFTVFVPEGWDAIPVPDLNDSSKTATNDILLARGAEYIPASDYWTYDSGPYFYVTLADKETFTKVSTSRDYYVEEYGSVKDMEDMTTGSLTWHGFSVNPIGADVYIMWAEAGDSGFYSSISTAYDLSLEDEDVQTILGSITLKE